MATRVQNTRQERALGCGGGRRLPTLSHTRGFAPLALRALQGEPVYGAVTDNWPTLEPYFNETGGWVGGWVPAWRLCGALLAWWWWVRFEGATQPQHLLPSLPPPSRLRAGSNSPSILPSYQQRELLELAVKSCKSLGLQIVSGWGRAGAMARA